jgi:hypothetical protein
MRAPVMKRFVFASIWLALGLCFLEVSAWALLRFSPGLSDRVSLAASGADSGERGRAAARIGHRFRGTFWEEVVHPYLGFVVKPPPGVDPGSIQALGLPWGGAFPGEHGDDTVVIGLFGGSVAAYFGEAGGVDRVAAALADHPALAGKRIAPVLAAHIGYKQPQQLMTLAWLQALGVRFDWVILLDGFNEVVAPAFELAPAGVFPFFPGHWHQRVASLETNTALREAIGEIAYRKTRRANAAASFLASPLARSHFAELVWALWDRREEHALEAVRRRLAEGEAAALSARDYAAKGPARPRRDPDAFADELATFWMESAREMRSLVAGRGGRFFHFLQPNQHVAGSKPIGAEEAAIAIEGGDAFAPHVARGYRALRERGELLARESDFHDLTQVFVHVEEPLYVDNIGHVGKRGNELLADAIAAAIRSDLDAAR